MWHDAPGQQFLFFDDVAPHRESVTPRIADDRRATPLIPHALSALFIRCSWPSSRPDEQLYRHLCLKFYVIFIIGIKESYAEGTVSLVVTQNHLILCICASLFNRTSVSKSWYMRSSSTGALTEATLCLGSPSQCSGVCSLPGRSIVESVSPLYYILFSKHDFSINPYCAFTL